MREIRTEIEILAPAGLVWDILTDFARYPEWNPTLPKVEGEARVGARLTVVSRPAGRAPMTFRPVVLTAEPGRELRWLGQLLPRWAFRGEHIFELEELDRQRCRLLHHERFGGFLLPLVWPILDRYTRQGFKDMNAALKARAEAAVAARTP